MSKEIENYESLTKEKFEDVLVDLFDKKPSTRKMKVSTGRLGIINYFMALWEMSFEMRGTKPTEEQSKAERDRLEKEYPHNALYTIYM